jgi:2-(1,2-epoxy-1,2-dihydrophenyl)acetyl-CoA isomerase
MAEPTSELLYEVKDRIATITLNRPEKLNAFTHAMIDRWAEALLEAKEDDGVHVVVVTGAGRAFCAGGDVGKMGEEEQPSPLDHKHYLWKHIHRIPLTLEELDKPVIAMVNGPAIGAGMDMVLQCDLRIASEEAKFCEAYVRVGLVPGDGGAYFLPRLVGTAKALELFWTGDTIDAREAERIGLVNRVVPAAQLKEATYELAGRIAAGPQIAIRIIKRAVYQSQRTDLRTALDAISSHLAVVRYTEDHQEGVRAFKEKRPPKFTGR